MHADNEMCNEDQLLYVAMKLPAFYENVFGKHFNWYYTGDEDFQLKGNTLLNYVDKHQQNVASSG